MTPTENDLRPVWLVRAGGRGEDEAANLEMSLAIIGYHHVPDLTGMSDWNEVRQQVQAASPRNASRANSNQATQLHSFAVRMQEGDIVALPFKTWSDQVALGRVTGSYQHQEIDGIQRHTRSVEWVRPDVPRSDFQEDLLASLRSRRTICQIKRNNAEMRIAAILSGNRDPHLDVPQEISVEPAPGEEEPDAQESLDIAETARDEIYQHIRSHFRGHEFARLVDEVLRAQGYHTLLSTPGPDGGVDILAGRGPLGFDNPNLCVQVKATEKPIAPDVLRSLRGAMCSFNATHGLLVSWSGFTSDLKKEARQAFFQVEIWGASKLIEVLCENYSALSEEIKRQIPLERVWVLALGAEEG